MNGFEDWMINPMTQMGLGILAANRPGASFGQAVGGGGLLGLRNFQEQQAAELKRRQFEQQFEQDEAARLARKQVQEMYPEIAPVLEAYPSAASQVLASKYRQPSQYGTTVQYVRDKRTAQVMPAQASQSGGVFIPNPDGSFSPFDPAKHELIKPFSPQDIGGSLIPFQPMTGQFGSSPSVYQQGQSLLGPDETIAPDSPLDQYGMPRSGYAGITKTLPPEQRPDVRAAQTEAEQRTRSALEAESNVKDLEARMPRLRELTKELSLLGKAATYTKGGQIFDTVTRELGIPVRDAAVARTEYTSKVDNEILPLLRETFGAQFTQKEGESLKATLGDPNKSPQEKDAVLRSFINSKEQELLTRKRRAGYGVNKPDPLGLR